MAAKTLQKRDPKDENLRVLQTEDGNYYVESTEGKILYNVVFNESETSCTCTDFAKNIKKNSEFKFKHILSVSNCLSSGDIVDGQFLKNTKPKLDDRFIITIRPSFRAISVSDFTALSSIIFCHRMALCMTCFWGMISLISLAAAGFLENEF